MEETAATDSYVLDTSALLTLWNDEQGADSVEHVLRSNAKIYISFMTCMESRYRLWKNIGKEESEEFSRYLDLLPVKRVDITDAIFEKAIEIKATHTLSVCDSWIIATAVEKNAVIVHKDPGFEQVKTMVELKTLPYKPASRKKRGDQ